MLLAGNPPPISGLVSTQRIALLSEIRNSWHGMLLRVLVPLQILRGIAKLYLQW